MKERNLEYEKKFMKYLFSFDLETHKKICKEINVKHIQNTLILVIYKEQDTIEGIVNDEEDFKKWLKIHNKRRKKEGTITENPHEFDLKEIECLEVEE